MADKRISALTAITDPAAGDLLAVTDISDSTEDKKITLEQASASYARTVILPAAEPPSGTGTRSTFSPHQGTNTSVTVETSRDYFWPFQNWVGVNIDTLLIQIQTGTGSGGDQCRLSLYSDSANQPNSLLTDFGLVDIDAAGDVTLTSVNYDLDPGLYWFRTGCDAAFVVRMPQCVHTTPVNSFGNVIGYRGNTGVTSSMTAPATATLNAGVTVANGVVPVTYRGTLL